MRSSGSREMSILYAEPSRIAITRLDIDGQGPEARVDPESPLVIRLRYRVQNPKTEPTDTVQIILFREDEFLKCIYNDVPHTPYTEGVFEFKCTAPTEEGKYTIRAGWGHNWNWPDQAYKYLLANPENTETIGVLYVGPLKLEIPTLIPAVIVAGSIGTLIGLMAIPKK